MTNVGTLVLQTKAIRRFVIMEKAPTRAFSWLKVATTAFTFKTLLSPSLMIIVSRTQFHIERPWGQCLFSIVSLIVS